MADEDHVNTFYAAQHVFDESNRKMELAKALQAQYDKLLVIIANLEEEGGTNDDRIKILRVLASNFKKDLCNRYSEISKRANAAVNLLHRIPLVVHCHQVEPTDV